MKTLKRYLYLVHRWLGIGLCLVFLLWFLSGIIMMYVEYPELTESERLRSLPDLNPDRITASQDQLMRRLPAGARITSMQVAHVLDRPVLQLTTGQGRFSLYADNGEPFAGLNRAQAEQVAGFFLPGSTPRYSEKIDIDQWTVSGGLDALRPLHKIDMNDNAGSQLYISDTTGQIARDTTRWERGWNWLGAVIHWIYPLQLRKHPALWSDLVIYLSLVAISIILTGVIAGILRLRIKRRYKQGRISPYRGLQKWHHLLGIVFSVFVMTFTFSGLMSMNPWGVFDSATSAAAQIQGYRGEAAINGQLVAGLNRLRQADIGTQGLKEAEWAQIDNQGYWILKYSDGHRTLLTLNNGQPLANRTLAEVIDSKAASLLPQAQIADKRLLLDYDNYYYSRHNRYRPLPVYRVKFDDTEATWYHIDATTGIILGRLTDKDRWQRWLYNGLHSLDFRILVTQRPLWDIVVILLSIIGTLFSVTGVVMGWRRLRGSYRKINKPVRGLAARVKEPPAFT